jgi:hypothetical protein
MLRIEIVLPDDQIVQSTLAQHMNVLGYILPGQMVTREELAETIELARKVQARIDEPETGEALGRFDDQGAIQRWQDEAVERAKNPAEVQPEPKKRGRPAKNSGAKIIKGLEEAVAGDVARTTVVEVEPQIRANPENRVEEPEEDAIQDIQDEIAEVEAARDPVNPLTVDDVRQALGGYVKKYGTPAALEDGAKLLAQALGNPPEGEPIWKMSILPDDQDALRKAAEAVAAAIEGNPFSREAV